MTIGKKKRKLIKTAFFAALFFVLLAAFSLAADGSSSADDGEKTLKEVEQELTDNVDKNLDGLDLGEFERFLSSLDQSPLDKSLKDYIKAIIGGDFGGGHDAFFKAAAKLVAGDAAAVVPMVVSIVIICLLSGFVSGITSDFLKKSTHEIIFFVCYALIIVILLTRVVGYIDGVKRLLSNMTGLMNILFPLLLTFMSALGGTIGAAAYQPLMATLAVTIIAIINAVILPCFIASIIFSIIGNMSETVRLEGFRRFFKSAANWLLGGVFTLFMLFVTAKGITGAAVDGVTVDAVKFAVSSYVPVLGGYLSDGFDLVMGSMVLIKNALGYTGIMVLLSMLLSPVVKMTVFILALKLTAAIAEPIADKRISKMISGLASNMQLLISSVLGVGFMFFVTVMLVVMTANAF
ncbi:MAG: stage III sporulation protein AE [Clostridiales bacterium]|jgi:stage III sporulation protein AE|nr:stage III sporulation protein AE [Clostridiales bacterium]